MALFQCIQKLKRDERQKEKKKNKKKNKNNLTLNSIHCGTCYEWHFIQQKNNSMQQFMKTTKEFFIDFI